MSELIGAPRGVYDILPEEAEQWQWLESRLKHVIHLAAYREIRVPIFENTDLFKRGVGETTDIVNKEMYTFLDKSDRSITLRPEGTAGVVRAYLSNGMHRLTPPVKLWYFGPMFRYERTQAGRQRQFHQIGIEALGSSGPAIDAEVILIANDCLEAVGIKDCRLELNSIGCTDCRPRYRDLLRQTLEPKLPLLCEDCKERFERNPLRMLDCKVETCQAQFVNLPSTIAELCQPCKEHWDGLLSALEQTGLKPVLNDRLVRGLDYYCRTVFEFITTDKRLGAQSTVCAGGRYDYLIETLGGTRTPAIGWAMGLERVRIISDAPSGSGPSVFAVSCDEKAALSIATRLRREGISCDLDFAPSGKPRGLGKQMEKANKTGARFAVIQGEDELASNTISIKDMKSGEQTRIPAQELVPFFSGKVGTPAN